MQSTFVEEKQLKFALKVAHIIFCHEVIVWELCLYLNDFGHSFFNVGNTEGGTKILN